MEIGLHVAHQRNAGFPRIDFYNILANPFTTTQPAVTLGARGQFTQLTEGIDDDFKLADQEKSSFGTVDSVAGNGFPDFIAFGAPTSNSFSFPTELPSYEIGNLRLGVRGDQWEGALFVNNLRDERALLSLDRERGSRARVGYLTNRPRTYGVTFRRSF